MLVADAVLMSSPTTFPLRKSAMTTIAGLLMRHVRLPRKKRPRQLMTKPMNLHQNQNHSQSLLKRRPKSASENRPSIK